MTDPFLPITNVVNVMKECLPGNMKITKEAKDLMLECITELICFVAFDAQKHSITQRRKTITGADVVQSVQALGFSRFHGFLTEYHHALTKK